MSVYAFPVFRYVSVGNSLTHANSFLIYVSSILATQYFLRFFFQSISRGRCLVVRFREFRGFFLILLGLFSLRSTSSLVMTNVYFRDFYFGLGSTIFIGFRDRSSSCVLYMGGARSLGFFLRVVQGYVRVLVGVGFLLVNAYTTRDGIILVRGLLFPSFRVVRGLCA